MEGSPVAEKTVAVASSSGLHARPAALFAQAAGALPVPVTIARADGGDPVPANSILMLMTLDAHHGEQVVLRADGEGAEEALTQLAALLEKDLDEEE